MLPPSSSNAVARALEVSAVAPEAARNSAMLLNPGQTAQLRGVPHQRVVPLRSILPGLRFTRGNRWHPATSRASGKGGSAAVH
jgi:hypothetical protein